MTRRIARSDIGDGARSPGGPNAVSAAVLKRLLVVAFAVLPLVETASAETSLNRSIGGARSQGMGGAFVSVADDGSALFVNPAGLASVQDVTLYFDYAEPHGISPFHESRIGLVVPSPCARFGLGWYRYGARDESAENLFVLGAARMLLEGTQGSFLSVGVSVSIARAGLQRDQGQAGMGVTESDVSADAGIILKPLPVIAFGYSVANVRNADLEDGGNPLWARVQRWGFSYVWEEKVTFSFEGEHLARSTLLHYGLCVKTATPLELMVGFSEGSAAGGARWAGDRLRVTVSFQSDGGRVVTVAGSCEIALRRASAGSRR